MTWETAVGGIDEQRTREVNRALWSLLRRLLNSRRRQEFTIAEHQAILDHIQQRNANGAANAMGAHLDAVMKELETFAAANPGLFADLQTKSDGST